MTVHNEALSYNLYGDRFFDKCYYLLGQVK